MAKKPNSGILTDAERKVIQQNIERQKYLDIEKRKYLEEQNRPKNYADILEYAKKFNELDSEKTSTAKFPSRLSISAEETVSPYYGDDFERQQAAAIEYAKSLKKDESVVQIDPKYYEDLKRKVPVKTAEVIPHYNVTRDELVLPSPVDMANFEMSLTDKQLAQNNYGSREDLARAFKDKLGDYYRDTIEHETGHIADKSVQFSPKPRSQYTEPKKDLGLGYMAQEDHLVTGLGKIQRERYAMEGSRIESPEDFKNFVFNLAKTENTEEAISNFSEEAKRAIRPQIINARQVQKYYDDLDAWEKSKSWFKGSKPPAPEAQLDFIEKSAQLMPALTQSRKTPQPTA
jgi:hypothetical protein